MLKTIMIGQTLGKHTRNKLPWRQINKYKQTNKHLLLSSCLPLTKKGGVRFDEGEQVQKA